GIGNLLIDFGLGVKIQRSRDDLGIDLAAVVVVAGQGRGDGRGEKPSPHDKREPLPRRRKTGEALDSTVDSAGSSSGTGKREPLPRLKGRSIGDDGACSAPSRSPLPRLRAQAVDLDKVRIIKQPDKTMRTSHNSVTVDASTDEFDETSNEGKVDEARVDVGVEVISEARDSKAMAALEIRKATSKAKQRKIRGSLRECLRLQPNARSTRRVKAKGGPPKAGPRIPPAELISVNVGAFDRLEGCEAAGASITPDASLDWTVVAGIPAPTVGEENQTVATDIPAPSDAPSDAAAGQTTRSRATHAARIRWRREASAQRVALIKARAMALSNSLASQSTDAAYMSSTF
ncbi:unnamed protein product, partial [Symbiodinium sp. KB8]